MSDFVEAVCKRLVCATVIVVASVFLFNMGSHYAEVKANSTPVCYAQSEDSPLTGCDYHDGVWTPVGLPDIDKHVKVATYTLPGYCVQKWADGTKEIACAWVPEYKQWVTAPWAMGPRKR